MIEYRRRVLGSQISVVLAKCGKSNLFSVTQPQKKLRVSYETISLLSPDCEETIVSEQVQI